MATLFIAVQCCHCSTMQVKQQRKGTISKWLCAVCNQRQSVRRIHARGPLARDLRKFVQDFNMARAAADTADADLGNPNPPLSRAEDDLISVSKRKTDWSEFLLIARFEESDGLPELAVVVTQLPLAKSATKRSFCFKSPVEKRKKTPIGAAGKAAAMDGKRGGGSSKWSEYLDCEEEEEEEETTKGAKRCAHKEAAWGGTQTQNQAVAVEEEIHPDFE